MSEIILTEQLAVRFARIALGHVGREYPNKPDHVLAGPQEARTPRELHPVFFGSYDWHSCVHSYWMLARLLRRYPASDAADAIRALFDDVAFSELNAEGVFDGGKLAPVVAGEFDGEPVAYNKGG